MLNAYLVNTIHPASMVWTQSTGRRGLKWQEAWDHKQLTHLRVGCTVGLESAKDISSARCKACSSVCNQKMFMLTFFLLHGEFVLNIMCSESPCQPERMLRVGLHFVLKQKQESAEESCKKKIKKIKTDTKCINEAVRNLESRSRPFIKQINKIQDNTHPVLWALFELTPFETGLGFPEPDEREREPEAEEVAPPWDLITAACLQ